MKLATFDKNGAPALGIVDGTQILDLAAAAKKASVTGIPGTMVELIASGPGVLQKVRDVAAKADTSDASLWRKLEGTRLLAPLGRPTKNVFCVGRNYKLHIEEGARARGREPTYPPVPEFFSKPPTAVVGHEDEVRLDPNLTKQFDWEVEFALVIGKGGRDLVRGKALEAVFGYTVFNDVTARDLQAAHGQWFKGKGLDTTAPIGPWIVTADEFGDPSGHRITLRLNGKTMQDSNTSDLLFDCDEILASLSHGLTLEPGDVIATGTPSGVGFGMVPQVFLKDGDVMEAEVEGIGVLRNTVRAAR